MSDVRANIAVKNALRRGDLVKPDRCSECLWPPASTAKMRGLVAHHDDYSKPLDVRWLCRRCHGQHHAVERGNAKVREGYRYSALVLEC